MVKHCVKSAQIQRNTEYLFVFSPNAGKYRPEKNLNLDFFNAVKVAWLSMMFDLIGNVFCHLLLFFKVHKGHHFN